jgi:hypothetical protein
MRQLVRLDRCCHQGVMEMVPAVVRVPEVDLEVADLPHLAAFSNGRLARRAKSAGSLPGEIVRRRPTADRR